jgi:hypothetical protein
MTTYGKWIGLAALGALALAACDKKDDANAKSGPSASGSASAKPTGSGASAATPAGSTSAATTASAAAAPPPAWYAKAPAKPSTAKVGDVAWTLHPFALNNSGAWLNPMEVTAASGNTVTMRELALMASGPDSWKLKPNPSGTLYAGIPGSVVVPARNVDAVKPKAGDIVWAGVTNAPAPQLVKVNKVDGGLVVYDRLDAMQKSLEKDQKVHYVEPYGNGIAPFTYVAVKSGDDYKMILVLGIDGDTVYGRSGDDFASAKKSECKPLKAAWKDRKKGDKVIAFMTGGDGKVGKIETVPMEKWVYKMGPFQYPWNMVFDAP